MTGRTLGRSHQVALVAMAAVPFIRRAANSPCAPPVAPQTHNGSDRQPLGGPAPQAHAPAVRRGGLGYLGTRDEDGP